MSIETGIKSVPYPASKDMGLLFIVMNTYGLTFRPLHKKNENAFQYWKLRRPGHRDEREWMAGL